MMEEKTKVIEKIVSQLHQGNFNPCIKSELPTPDREQAHPLEMSCIPFVGSPSQQRGEPGTSVSDNVFLDTPELVCASKFVKVWLLHIDWTSNNIMSFLCIHFME